MQFNGASCSCPGTSEFSGLGLAGKRPATPGATRSSRGDIRYPVGEVHLVKFCRLLLCEDHSSCRQKQQRRLATNSAFTPWRHHGTRLQRTPSSLVQCSRWQFSAFGNTHSHLTQNFNFAEHVRLAAKQITKSERMQYLYSTSI